MIIQPSFTIASDHKGSAIDRARRLVGLTVQDVTADVAEEIAQCIARTGVCVVHAACVVTKQKCWCAKCNAVASA